MRTKIKTKKILTRRLKITKNGKILRRQSFRRHLKSSKSAKRLKNLKRVIELKGYFAKKVHKATGTNAPKALKVRKTKATK